MKPTEDEREELRADVASWLRQWDRTGMWHTPISVAQCRTILAMLAERKRMPHPDKLSYELQLEMAVAIGGALTHFRAAADAYRIAWNATHPPAPGYADIHDEVREMGT